mgnify:CR=1 FL=1
MDRIDGRQYKLVELVGEVAALVEYGYFTVSDGTELVEQVEKETACKAEEAN